ncbi:MAG: hypothetical protein H6835_02640 [Planctomycetes bacterium]|nr:hypothetical protein [Planctomycetota bacterium]
MAAATGRGKVASRIGPIGRRALQPGAASPDITPTTRGTTVRLATSILFLLIWAACGKRPHQDFTSAVGAARSFVEAGRVGDIDAVREALVVAERRQQITCDYSQLQDGDFALVFDREIDEDHAVVQLQCGPIASPLACVREGGAWKVTMHGSLALMRQQVAELQPAAPAR